MFNKLKNDLNNLKEKYQALPDKQKKIVHCAAAGFAIGTISLAAKAKVVGTVALVYGGYKLTELAAEKANEYMDNLKEETAATTTIDGQATVIS